MSCEQVRELLSAYLDDQLALEEQAAVAVHMQACANCCAIFEDFRRFDTLLAQLPRTNPSPLLRLKIFTTSEYLEFIGTLRSQDDMHYETF
ncbi:MAG TPA: zf-HC2 domain-containing protein [Ktedonobacteraceae bacterium]|jgi:predicted anti-sigma-YlaC factor YlaD|nr:zf-HC2 domain-containing protein [Ktedonobacteraceae bacterium]